MIPTPTYKLRNGIFRTFPMFKKKSGVIRVDDHDEIGVGQASGCGSTSAALRPQALSTEKKTEQKILFHHEEKSFSKKYNIFKKTYFFENSHQIILIIIDRC